MMIPVPTEAPVSPSVARRVDRIVAAPPAQPGFIGEGHLAVEVLEPREIPRDDPFVLLMDDRLDIAKRRQALVQHGPFVADTEGTITRFFQDYRAGRFQHLSTLAPG
jgi:hypothetical protein